MKVEAGLCGFSPLKLNNMAAIAFSSGQKFRFANDPAIYTFISIRFEDNEPIISYANENDEECEAHGFYLSDLSPA